LGIAVAMPGFPGKSTVLLFPAMPVMITDQVKKYKHLLEICHPPVYL
jgi:hypothetical protein